MKILLSIMIALFSLGALVAIRLPHRIPNKGLRSVLILLGAFAAFAVAARSLYEQSSGFEKPLSDYLGSGLLVPLGWFLAGSFIIIYALAKRRLESNASNARPEQAK